MSSVIIQFGDLHVEIVDPRNALDDQFMQAAMNNLISAAFDKKFPGRLIESLMSGKVITLYEMLEESE